MAGNAHGTNDSEEPAPDPAVSLHLLGALPDRLDDQRNGPLAAVEIGDGQRDALAQFVVDDDDELAWPGRPRHHGMTDFDQERGVGEILSRHDFESRPLVDLAPRFEDIGRFVFPALGLVAHLRRNRCWSI